MSVQQAIHQLEQALQTRGHPRTNAGTGEPLDALCRAIPDLLQQDNTAQARETRDRLQLALGRWEHDQPAPIHPEVAGAFMAGQVAGILRVLDPVVDCQPDPRLQREMAHRAVREIIALLGDWDGLFTGELAQALGKDIAGVSRTLHRMEDAGIVYPRAEGRKKLWWMTSEGLRVWRLRHEVRDGDW